MEVTIQLKGFDELAAKLREMPQDIARNALRSSVSAGAAVIRDEAKLQAPVLSGTLRRAMYIKQIRELSDAQRQTFYVGARQGKRYQKVGKKGRNYDAFYARFVEFGHFTRPPGGGQLKRGRGRVQSLQIMLANKSIKFVDPDPFLGPAFREKKDAAINSMAAKLRERIERFRVQGK